MLPLWEKQFPYLFCGSARPQAILNLILFSLAVLGHGSFDFKLIFVYFFISFCFHFDFFLVSINCGFIFTAFFVSVEFNLKF